MSRTPSSILFAMVFVLVAGAPATSADDPPELVFDELGMLPRPTMECGGKDAIQRWETERLLRRTNRARDRLSAFAHAVCDRLSAVKFEAIAAMHRKRLAAFDDCIQEAPLLDQTCVAVAFQRPELCSLKATPEIERACRLVVATVASVREGNPMRCADLSKPHLRRLCERVALGNPERSILCPVDDYGCKYLTFLNLDICRIWWPLSAWVPQSATVCRWAVLVEALRLDSGLDCEGVPTMLRDLCRAVVGKDPSACPPQRFVETFGGVALARGCRNAQVPTPEITTDQVAYGNGVILSIPLFNAFLTAAVCRVTVRLSADGRVQTEATSEPFTLQPDGGHNGSLLTVKRFRMAPAPAGLEVDVTSDCVWAAGEEPIQRRDGMPVVD